ncbi:D-hexose-6-phosphate mutarotase [Brachybacterium saurashtrense]|nr:D-hexose-6-phosphate mutarotase [Brachybacterium saurashtrense]
MTSQPQPSPVEPAAAAMPAAQDPAAAAPDAAVTLPEGVALGTAHGVDAVLVDTPAASAVILLDGAHLTSFVPAGEQDLLWMSPSSDVGPGVAVRGGIPLVGPWFGTGRDLAHAVKHGWLRNVRWDLVSARREGGTTEVTLRTPEDAVAVRAEVVFRLGAQLDVDLTLTAGPRRIELEAALHTYLAVGDVREIRIGGLEGAEFLDNTRGLAEDVMPAQLLRLTGSTDRIVARAGEVTLEDDSAPGGGRRVVSTPRGTSRTIVWNPWDELTRGMADIPDEDWPRFVCIEPAVAKDGFVALEPGRSHRLGVSYRIER